MIEIRWCSDIEDCRQVWGRLIHPRRLFDSWDVRFCFQKHYRNPPRFLVAWFGRHPVGLLPLSRIDEYGYYGYFPGETWAGKTWMEQNRIPADSTRTRCEMLAHCPDETHLRYLTNESVKCLDGAAVDETGYFFYPDEFGFSMDRYWNVFSGKSRKRLGLELARWDEAGLKYRFGRLADVEWMFQANLESFGERSYFHDERFLRAFEDLLRLLEGWGRLRITSAMVGGRLAAVDVGAVVEGRYTVLAGGTDGEFTGIAKAINLHHMEWACRCRLREVDFLCGDFGWKERFHLRPNALYAWSNSVVRTVNEPRRAVNVLG
ncbi:MAG: GNAT family N-acetyltransferase [Planctomycetota bacterium]|nr:GNAT family N-acetyltransferase [Planctomycetota bacterium]